MLLILILIVISPFPSQKQTQNPKPKKTPIRASTAFGFRVSDLESEEGIIALKTSEAQAHKPRRNAQGRVVTDNQLCR
jgi:hypothetical protein